MRFHKRRKLKIVPGSLMKAVIRPGGGELTPSDGDQVSIFVYFLCFHICKGAN